MVDKFRRIDVDQSENGNLVQDVMEEEWDALRQEKNNCLSSDSLQFNPFASAAEVLSITEFCCCIVKIIAKNELHLLILFIRPQIQDY